MRCLETSEENVTTHDMETADLAVTEEKLCTDAVGNEDVKDDDDQSLSKIVVQVELERQLVDRQEHRLSYDEPLDVSNQMSKQVSSGKLDEKSSSGHKSSEIGTPEKESSSSVIDKTPHEQSISQEQTHQEVEKTPGGVVDGGGSSMGSKTKLIKTFQSRHLSTLDEKNEDLKRTPSDARVEKEANRQRRGDDKRQPSTGRLRAAADTEKPSVKGISGFHRNLGRVKSCDASSQMPAISSSRVVPSLGENAGGLSVNRLRRSRVASLDLGNTSSSSSSLKRSGMRRETLRETSICEPTKERGNTERPQNGKLQTVTAAATKKRPSLLLHLNSSFTAGKTYAIVKNNKTPSDSNLFGSETVVSSSILSRRTSTPLPSAEEPASCSSSMSPENSRPSLPEKQQLSVSANKKGLKSQSLVVNSKSKTTTAGKCGQLKPKIGKES